MAKTAAPINPRQKAAVFALAAGILHDWGECYIAAHEARTKEAEILATNYSNVTHWKNQKKIQDYFQEATEKINRDRARQHLEGVEEGKKMNDESQAGSSEHTQTKGKTDIAPKVDYYDPANQRKQINRIIQEASDDPKTQLDAIKAIQQTQRDDRQAARDQKQVVFHLPLRCDSCPLYEKARRKAAK